MFVWESGRWGTEGLRDVLIKILSRDHYTGPRKKAQPKWGNRPVEIPSGRTVASAKKDAPPSSPPTAVAPFVKARQQQFSGAAIMLEY